MSQSTTQDKMSDKMSSSNVSPVSSIKDAAKEGMDKLQNTQIKEGEFTKKVESQTAKIPSISFLSFALGSIAISATLATFKRKDAANFVGLWAPTFLLLGIYNKLVKLQGSEQA